MKVALDDASLEFVRERLEQIDDPLLRQLIWQALWNMVRDQQLSSIDYLKLAGPKVATERDPELVESTLTTMTASVGRYVPEEQKAAFQPKEDTIVASRLQQILKQASA